jgi:anti-anti-sigma regulatory factor
MDVHLSVLARDHCAVVWACGRCDVGNAARLYDRLVDVLTANRTRVILDLSALTVLDGAAFDALAAVSRHARHLGGSLVIFSGPVLG